VDQSTNNELNTTAYRLESITCSNCRKELGSIIIKNSDPSIITKLVVKCPFCDDKSFMKKIVGKFHFGTVENIVMSGSYEEDGVFIINLTRKQ
jgi:DNA-directed RNA polymerase subunit RPC12/RpoP